MGIPFMSSSGGSLPPPLNARDLPETTHNSFPLLLRYSSRYAFSLYVLLITGNMQRILTFSPPHNALGTSIVDQTVTLTFNDLLASTELARILRKSGDEF